MGNNMSTDGEGERTVLSVRGSDRHGFLKGLVTNDVKDGLTYSALLTPQGKYLADFFLIERADDILIDVSASIAAPLAQRLSMYKLRADVSIEALEMTVGRGVGPMPAGAMPDPRHAELGWRHYDGEGEDGVDWDAIRVRNCIPATGVELTPATYILEAGFERLNGVDYKKGCFVGQEVTARMKHKTVLKKGFRTVALSQVVPAGTEIVSGEKVMGAVFTQSGGQAIAYLRLSGDGATQILGDMMAGPAKVTLA
jgi:folate-binding protein YgfZ